ncbi:MAG: DUF1932 domain-containing protein [Nitrososphaerota archaeon]
MDDMLVVAVLGLGEAGSAIARGLVQAGVKTRGWDPAPRADVQGIPLAPSGPAAVEGAHINLSINAAAVAVDVAQSVVSSLAPASIFADFNTSTPELKRQVARIVEPVGALFVDVALLAPVPGRGIHTPALVSGSGAAAFLASFMPLGMPVEIAGSAPGEAATRKLLRSVFMKGWAAAVIESLEAARRLGVEEWLRQEIAREFTTADERLMIRLIEGSRQHAVRRVEEMESASQLLGELGITPRIASASAGWLRELAGKPDKPVER